jgi:hypothetical protein
MNPQDIRSVAFVETGLLPPLPGSQPYLFARDPELSAADEPDLVVCFSRGHVDHEAVGRAVNSLRDRGVEVEVDIELPGAADPEDNRWAGFEWELGPAGPEAAL